MAKESMKAREVKREKLVAKYAEKRKALKEAGDWAALDKLPRTPQQYVFTIVALLPDVQKDTCVPSASAESSSVKWQATVLFRA